MANQFDEYSKQLARFFFEYLGYTVTDIPEVDGKKSADLFIETADDKKPPAIVEAKEKLPDVAEANARNDALKSGVVHGRDAAITEQSTLNRVMDGAIQQVIDTVSRYPNGTLRFVFIVCTGYNAEQRFDQFKSRVLGSATIVDFSDEGQLQDCAFFKQSDMHKYRKHIDAFVLAKDHPGAEGMGATFLINPYADGYDVLSATESLVEQLGEGFVDVPKRDALNEMWSLHDMTGNRSNEGEMLGLMREKYGLSEKVMSITMNHHVAEVLVPKTP